MSCSHGESPRLTTRKGYTGLRILACFRANYRSPPLPFLHSLATSNRAQNANACSPLTRPIVRYMMLPNNAPAHTERAERPRWELVFAFLTSPCEAPGRAPTAMCATDRLPVVWNLPFEENRNARSDAERGGLYVYRWWISRSYPDHHPSVPDLLDPMWLCPEHSVIDGGSGHVVGPVRRANPARHR